MTTRICIDLVLEHHQDAADLRRALSVCTGVAEERIAVVDDITELLMRDSADVVCIRYAFPGGEFVEKLSLDGDLMVHYESELRALECLCEKLRTRGLTPVDEPDPYLFWLISPGEETRQVAVDVDAYDDEEERFVLARE
jgi:hypothetical protein